MRVCNHEIGDGDIERFICFLEFTESGCWLWTGSVASGTGYGVFTVRHEHVHAHRFAYELWVAPIPEGLHSDHLCRNRACANPDHIEPVSQRVNSLRGVGIFAQNARKTTCDNGHSLTEVNTYRRLDNGGRQCRTCTRERNRKYKQKARNADANLFALPSE